MPKHLAKDLPSSKQLNQIVHIANTNVEFEFAYPSLQPLEESLCNPPLCLQLQFLPLLYAQPEDIVAVTAMPSQDYLATLENLGWWPKGLPRLALLQDYELFRGGQCLSWGPSRQVRAWAQRRQMQYLLPDWHIAQLINSKAFSFRYSCLPEAALLLEERDLMTWLQNVSGPKVLKTCFGLSGAGNYRIDDSFPLLKIMAFCRREWQQKRPIIGEPWLHRLQDFSTQWLIHPNQCIEWIGATRFQTNPQGIYQGTLVGPEATLFVSLQAFLEEHRQFVQNVLQAIASLGFFGYLGIDAFIYRHPDDQSIRLYPLVEINGRQTMSLVALRLQQRLFPQQILRFSFQSHPQTEKSLLPLQLVNVKGKEIKFQKRLTATLLDAVVD